MCPVLFFTILFFNKVTLGIFIQPDKRVNSPKVNRLDYISWLYSGSHVSKQPRLYFEIVLHVLQACWLSCSPGTDSVSSTGQNRLPSVFLHILIWHRDSRAPVKSAQLWPRDSLRWSFPPAFTPQSAMMKLCNFVCTSEKQHDICITYTADWRCCGYLIKRVHFRGNLKCDTKQITTKKTGSDAQQ